MTDSAHRPAIAGKEKSLASFEMRKTHGESDFAHNERVRKQRKVKFWDSQAPERDRWRKRGSGYHAQILELLRFLIPEGSRVLEVGCATGEILASLHPSHGVGIDFSPAMVEVASSKFPEYRFVVGDVEDLPEGIGDPEQPFDYVVMSDVVGHVSDIWKAFRELRGVVGSNTRLVLTWYNFLWEPLLKIGEKIGLKMPVPNENWLSYQDLEQFLALNHFEVVFHSSRSLLPKNVPVLTPLINNVFSPLPLFRLFNFIQFLVAKPTPIPEPEEFTTSVVIPCRNEQGNIRPAVERMPRLGTEMEVIFCDGNSTDGTIEAIEALAKDPEAPFPIRLLHQDGKGKNDAMRKAFDHCKNELYFILDSDLTVPPEDLPKFYHAVAEGKGDMINGTRLVYPMEDNAMRSLNIIGNKFFSLLLSWILGQRIKDTLCGTKVLRATHYKQIVTTRDYFGDYDPFCDFDLIFGAARHNLKIADLPVRYRARTYGDIKIRRFRDGWLLCKMSWLAFLKLKLRR